MKTTRENQLIAKRAELYRVISLNRLSKTLGTTKEEAKKILDKAVKKGVLTYTQVGRKLYFSATPMTHKFLA